MEKDFESWHKKKSAFLSQIKLIDGKRLNYKIGDLSEIDFAEIKKRLRQFLA